MSNQEAPIPPDSPEYDQLTEDLKALRAFRTQNALEYAADPEKFKAKRRARKYPGVTFATLDQTSKDEEKQK